MLRNLFFMMETSFERLVEEEESRATPWPVVLRQSLSVDLRVLSAD
jgi:hypothetical protein